MASLLVRIAKWAIWHPGVNQRRREAYGRRVPPRPAMVRQWSPQTTAMARSFGSPFVPGSPMMPPKVKAPTTRAPELPRPRTKQEAQILLRLHGIKGLRIDAIENGRIYALTAKKLMPDNTMRRRAVTVVFMLKDETQVTAVQLEGWLVDDQIPWSSL